MYRISLAVLLLFFASTVKCLAQGAEQDKVTGHTAYIKGMEAFENEEYREAVSLFSKAYSKLPNSSGIIYSLADAYLQLGDLSNAAYYAGQAVTMDPSNRWYRFTLAHVQQLQGQNAAAIEQYRSILQNHPDDRHALGQLARALDKDNQPLEANKVYDKLLNGGDSDIALRLKKAGNYLQLDMNEEALTELNRIRALEPKQTAVLQSLSELYLELGYTDLARSLLQNDKTGGQRDPRASIKLADFYANQNNWTAARETLAAVITDTLAERETKLAAVQLILAKYNSAPSDPDIAYTASELLHTLTVNEPDYARAHQLAAKFYVQTDQPQKALQALAATTRLQPLDDEAWKQRLQLLLGQKEFQQVLGLAPEAEENIPQDPFILYFTGSAHLELKKYDKAYHRLLAATRYPARRAFKSLIYTALAKAQAGQDRLEDARKSLQQALKMNAENAEAMEHLGNIFDKLGNSSLAREWWQKALDKDPSRSHLKQKILE